MVRALAATPIVWAWALWRVGPRALYAAPPRAVAGAAFAGALCYYIGSLLDFNALTMVAASIERVLLFSYPSMVVVLHSCIHRRAPSARVLGALALTYAGIFAVVTGFDTSVLRANLAGAGLVLACAFTFAIYYLVSDRLTPRIGSIPFTTYALTTATVCLAIHYPLRHDYSELPWSRDSLGLLTGVVLVSTVIAMLAMSEGVRRLGAQRAAVVSTVGPPFTILMGAWLLDERLSAAQWSGVALIVAGVLVLEVMKSKAPSPAPD